MNLEIYDEDIKFSLRENIDHSKMVLPYILFIFTSHTEITMYLTEDQYQNLVKLS